MLRSKGGGKQDWATPLWFYQGLESWLWQKRRERFALDAAASPHNAKHATFYTEQTNGLSQHWLSWTFCNPPYANILPWALKARKEQLCGVGSVLVLPANGMTSRWYREIRSSCFTYILSPRVLFVGPKKSPNGGVMLLEFNPDFSVVQPQIQWLDVSDWKQRFANAT